MEWTPNDIVLSIDAYIRRKAHPEQANEIVAELAQATNRKPTAARAGIDAIGNADPDLGKGPRLTPFADAVARHLVANPKELRSLVRAIRGR